jgi:hypothetical protein
VSDECVGWEDILQLSHTDALVQKFLQVQRHRNLSREAILCAMVVGMHDVVEGYKNRLLEEIQNRPAIYVMKATPRPLGE